MQDHSTIPLGFCQCGCGQPTNIITITDSKRGAFKGQSRKFLPNHHMRLPEYQRKPKASLEQRFWSKVVKTTTCWLWTDKLDTIYGYGRFRDSGTKRQMLAHRYSYELHFGTILDGQEVLHACDNRGCVNPDHFYLGKSSNGSHGRMYYEIICPYCGNAKLTQRSDQVYCSKSCASRAYRVRCGQGPGRDLLRKKRHNAEYRKLHREELNAKKRTWRIENPELAKERDRASYLRNRDKALAYSRENKAEIRAKIRVKNTGMTPEMFQHNLEAQGYRCPICGKPLDWSGSADHDHETGQPRGVLCRECNVALGFLVDDPERLRKAREYILQWRENGRNGHNSSQNRLDQT